MTGFDERETGFEKKMQLDSEFAFKVAMKRNKMLGRWAAEQLSLEGDDIEAYVAEVVKSDFEEVGDEDVIRKVLADFKAADLALDDSAIREQIETYNAAAAEQLMTGE